MPIFPENTTNRTTRCRAPTRRVRLPMSALPVNLKTRFNGTGFLNLFFSSPHQPNFDLKRSFLFIDYLSYNVVML